MEPPRFDKYYRYAEMVAFLDDCVASHPTLAALEVIGKSHEGRDIPALTVTNTETGPALSKPALYIDANIHGSEVTACSSCREKKERQKKNEQRKNNPNIFAGRQSAKYSYWRNHSWNNPVFIHPKV